MEDDTELTMMDVILELCALLRDDNRYAKEPYTLANAYDIFNGFC